MLNTTAKVDGRPLLTEALRQIPKRQLRRCSTRLHTKLARKRGRQPCISRCSRHHLHPVFWALALQASSNAPIQVRDASLKDDLLFLRPLLNYREYKLQI